MVNNPQINDRGVSWRAVLKKGGVYKSFGLFDFKLVQNKHKKPEHAGSLRSA